MVVIATSQTQTSQVMTIAAHLLNLRAPQSVVVPSRATVVARAAQAAQAAQSRLVFPTQETVQQTVVAGVLAVVLLAMYFHHVADYCWICRT